MRSSLPIASLSALALLLPSCETDVDLSVNYNPTTQIVTGTAKVKGESKSRTINVEGIVPDASGCIVIEDPDCGVVRICGGITTSPVNVTITCGDPILLQVPEAWTTEDGDWVNDIDGASGLLMVDPATDFVDSSEGATVYEPGMKGLVVLADEIFDTGIDGTLTLRMNTGGDDPVGMELKAQDIAVVDFFDDTGTRVAREIAVQLGDGPIEFASGATFSGVVEAEGGSGSGTGGADGSTGGSGGADGSGSASSPADSGAPSPTTAASGSTNSGSSGGCGCTTSDDAPLAGLLLLPLLALCRRRERGDA